VIISFSSTNSENYEIFLSEQTLEPSSQSRRNFSRESHRVLDRYDALVMKHALMCAADIMNESLTHHAAMSSAQSNQ
jgi:hypothetical protein